VTFASREDAGQRLGEYLAARNVRPDWVLGLPRGGVVVATQVARILDCPLGTIAVRKIGHPRQREYAIGAIAEGGIVRLDDSAMAEANIDPQAMERVIHEETNRLQAAQRTFHPNGKPDLGGKAVLIVDDGLATGATAEAAVLSAQTQNAKRVEVAVPVSSESAAERLERVADGFFALEIDRGFGAVGQYYESFPQVSDAAVLALLV